MELDFCCKRCLKGMTLLLNECDQIQFISYKKAAFATVAADSLSRLVSFYMTMTSSVFSPWSYFYIPAEGIWVFALNGAKTQVARGHILRNG